MLISLLPIIVLYILDQRTRLSALVINGVDVLFDSDPRNRQQYYLKTCYHVIYSFLAPYLQKCSAAECTILA